MVLEGTKVTLTLTPKGIRGWMSAHIHKGAAGVDGKLVTEFPWESGDGSPRRYVGSVSEKVAADMAANPEKYYVHVHLPDFPAGGARGQLAARPNAEPSPGAAPVPVVATEYDPRAVQSVGQPQLTQAALTAGVQRTGRAPHAPSSRRP